MNTVNVKFFLVIEATLNHNGEQVRGTPSVRTCKNKPSVNANEVPIAINIQLPISLFKRPSLEASILIPDSGLPTEIDATVQSSIVEAIKSATGLEIKLNVSGEHVSV